MTTAFHPDDVAAEWALRLSTGPLTPAEESSLSAWLESDAGNRARLDSFRMVYARLETTVPAMVGEGELPDFRAKVIRPHRALFRALTAAAALIALTGSVLFWQSRRPVPYVTAASQRSSLTLADGSHLDLNARTSLAVELQGSDRHVRLTEGEAFFAVAKDPSRPFFVETPAGIVRVTGTQFNVRALTPTQLEVTVLEGSVQVTPSNEETQVSGFRSQVSLVPHDQLLLDDAQLTTRTLSAEATNDVVAWRNGWLVFESERLDRAAEQFAHYHGKRIEVSRTVAALEFGGRFQLDELDAFLEGIQVSLPVLVERDGDLIRIRAK